MANVANVLPANVALKRLRSMKSKSNTKLGQLSLFADDDIILQLDESGIRHLGKYVKKISLVIHATKNMMTDKIIILHLKFILMAMPLKGPIVSDVSVQ